LAQPFGKQLAETDTEPIGFLPYDATGADSMEIIETQFKRFRNMQLRQNIEARAIAR
jgi:hypothetical protein